MKDALKNKLMTTIINSKSEVPFRHSVYYHFIKILCWICKKRILTVIVANLTDKLWTDYERCAEKSIDDDNDHKF